MEDKKITPPNDDLLLQQFFADAACQQVADDGFTERVMRRLPARVDWFSRLWTLGCWVVFVVCFVAFDGWQLLSRHLDGLLHTLLTTSFDINLPMLAAILFGLLFVGIGEVVYFRR
jgi:hypothetical protein